MASNILLNDKILETINRKLRPYVSERDWNKLFIIGPLKTGTTSIKTALEIIGYSTSKIGVNYKNIDNQRINIDSLTLDVIHGRYSNLFKFTQKFDFFVDNPYGLGLNFVALDALFPNSKFIYTYRDSESWFNSWMKFWNLKLGLNLNDSSNSDIRSIKQILGPARCYWLKHYFLMHNGTPNWNLLFNKPHFCSQKEKRFVQIQTYFRYRKSDLLVIDISNEKNISKVVDFLGLPQCIDFSMPHAYNTKNIKKSDGPQLSNFAKLKRQSITLDYINDELIY